MFLQAVELQNDQFFILRAFEMYFLPPFYEAAYLQSHQKDVLPQPLYAIRQIKFDCFENADGCLETIHCFYVIM